MRQLLCCTCVCALVAFIVAGASRASSHSDGQIRSAVKYWFDRLGADYSAANSCHGCPEGADSLVSDGQQCMNAINRIRYYDTLKVHAASVNAFEACRYYGLFGISWETSYSDTDSQLQADDFALAKSRQARARLYARKAAVALNLPTYP